MRTILLPSTTTDAFGVMCPRPSMTRAALMEIVVARSMLSITRVYPCLCVAINCADGTETTRLRHHQAGRTAVDGVGDRDAAETAEDLEGGREARQARAEERVEEPDDVGRGRRGD